MTKRVAINGLGRIGRMIVRLLADHPHLHVVAVNDLVPADNLAYLLKYDTIHGTFPSRIGVDGEALLVDGRKIRAFAEKDPLKLPWKELEIDLVIESTGKFTNAEDAALHLQAGAERVVLSAPAKGNVPTYVMGVNHKEYNAATDRIVSNASCTTNCLAPLAKVLLDSFGIEEGLMTTVHAVTAVQPVVDGPSRKDWRGGRAAGHNIIPASTGAATAVALCLPALKGKLTGMAFRVPVADVSVVDLTVRLTRPTTYEAICAAMKEASEGPMRGILGYCDEELVSSDFIGSTYSSIFDVKAGIALNPTFFKLVAWYDNEVAYAARLIDLVEYMVKL